MTNSQEVSLGSAFAFVKCQPRQSRCWKTQRNWAIIGSNLPIITRSLSALLRNYCFAGVFMWSRWELRHNYCVGLQSRDRSVTKVNMKYHNFSFDNKIQKMCKSWRVCIPLLVSANWYHIFTKKCIVTCNVKLLLWIVKCFHTNLAIC